MRVYLVTDADLEALFAAIDRDPRWGAQGGSSQCLSEAERDAHAEAHRFYNYQLRTWVRKITEPGKPS